MQMANMVGYSGGWAQSEGDWNGKQECGQFRLGIVRKGFFLALEEVTDVN